MRHEPGARGTLKNQRGRKGCLISRYRVTSGVAGPETDNHAQQPLHGEGDDQVQQIERGVGPSEAVLGNIARKDGIAHDRRRADGGNCDPR